MSFLPDEKNRGEFVGALMEKHSFIKRKVIGKSLCGRDIESFWLKTGTEPVLLCGAFHGMEWITTLILLSFMSDFCGCLEAMSPDDYNMIKLINQQGICVVPCVNPDGVEIQMHGAASAGNFSKLVTSISTDTSHWQANARGVDLNHNFPAGYDEVKKKEREMGIFSPAATRYGGEMPFSEPETIALRDFITENNFRHILCFHSQGREIYYDYGPKTPSHSYQLAKTLADACGYEVSRPDGIAVGGGCKDWFIDAFGKSGFTVEVGLGENPLPPSDFKPEYERLKKMLFLAVTI